MEYATISHLFIHDLSLYAIEVLDLNLKFVTRAISTNSGYFKKILSIRMELYFSFLQETFLEIY